MNAIINRHTCTQSGKIKPVLNDISIKVSLTNTQINTILCYCMLQGRISFSVRNRVRPYPNTMTSFHFRGPFSKFPNNPNAIVPTLEIIYYLKRRYLVAQRK